MSVNAGEFLFALDMAHSVSPSFGTSQEQWQFSQGVLEGVKLALKVVRGDEADGNIADILGNSDFWNQHGPDDEDNPAAIRGLFLGALVAHGLEVKPV